MRAADVRLVVQQALERTGASPQIVSDNGYNSERLRAALHYLPPAEHYRGDPEAWRVGFRHDRKVGKPLKRYTATCVTHWKGHVRSRASLAENVPNF